MIKANKQKRNKKQKKKSKIFPNILSTFELNGGTAQATILGPFSSKLYADSNTKVNLVKKEKVLNL